MDSGWSIADIKVGALVSTSVPLASLNPSWLALIHVTFPVLPTPERGGNITICYKFKLMFIAHCLQKITYYKTIYDNEHDIAT